MRSHFLRARSPIISIVSLRTKEPLLSEAFSLSVALKPPDRSFGATTDSRASSFTAGSAHNTSRSFAYWNAPTKERDLAEILSACKMVSPQV